MGRKRWDYCAFVYIFNSKQLRSKNRGVSKLGIGPAPNPDEKAPGTDFVFLRFDRRDWSQTNDLQHVKVPANQCGDLSTA